MIENLNKQLFAPYGKILRESPAIQHLSSAVIWTQELRPYFRDNTRYNRCEGETYLEFESGMTVLLLRKNGNSVAFYLDKPVCLPGGTEFALLPYQSECSVRVIYPTGKAPT